MTAAKKQRDESLESWLVRIVQRLRAWPNFRMEDHGKEYGDAFKMWAHTYGRDAVSNAIDKCREDSERNGAEFLPALPVLKRYVSATDYRPAQRCDVCRPGDGWAIAYWERGKPFVARCQHDGKLGSYTGSKP